ncbi:MAG: YkvA family protein [Candidatus Muiribacteriota bacterium]
MDDINNVDETDVEYAAKKGNKKVEDLEKDKPSALIDIWEDIKLLIGLVGDYVSRKYRETPWKTIAAAAGAIIYFASPIDVIPDFIPIAGYLDDALVLKLAIDFSSEDLIKYKKWKESAN